MAQIPSLSEMIDEPHSVVKRDGRIVPFDETKILHAILKSAGAVADREGKPLNEQEARKVTALVVQDLPKLKKHGRYEHSQNNIPDIEDVHSAVIHTLKGTGHNKTAFAYQTYKEQRDIDRKLIVVRDAGGRDPTETALFVYSPSKEEVVPWDRRKIAFSLMEEAKIDEAKAYSIAKETEKRILHWAGMRNYANGKIKLRTAKIREFANEAMEDFGLEKRLKDTSTITIPAYDIWTLMTGKSKENSNITANNPEAVSASISETAIKQFMLSQIFSQEVSDAHLEGRIHLHDLGYGPRVYCSSHSLANLGKYGLKLENLSTTSNPAKHAFPLVGHLNTFLASMQAYYAGALGVAYINDTFAAYLDADLEKLRQRPKEFISEMRGLLEKESVLSVDDLVEVGVEKDVAEQIKTKLEGKFRNSVSDIIDRLSDAEKTGGITQEEEYAFIKQIAQYLIFSGSQMAFSRGGQTLFLDFNIHTGTPKHLRYNPAIGPGGKYHLRKNGKLVPLEERIRTEGKHLMSDLYLD